MPGSSVFPHCFFFFNFRSFQIVCAFIWFIRRYIGSDSTVLKYSYHQLHRSSDAQYPSQHNISVECREKKKKHRIGIICSSCVHHHHSTAAGPPKRMLLNLFELMFLFSILVFVFDMSNFFRLSSSLAFVLSSGWIHISQGTKTSHVRSTNFRSTDVISLARIVIPFAVAC